VSHLGPGELVHVALQLRGRADGEWQRAVNLHAALIAVMIFFASQADPFLTARLIVFAFYSYNVAMVMRSLTDACAGLDRVTADLRLLPPPAQGGAVLGWLTARRFAREGFAQCVLLAVVWAVVAWLMIGWLLLGGAPAQP
jgi:hypothetical protein